MSAIDLLVSQPGQKQVDIATQQTIILIQRLNQDYVPTIAQTTY